MCNIMIYVEENLIFKPEQCYEMKTNMFNNSNNNNSNNNNNNNNNNKKSSKKIPNAPLISPQSTLNDNNFKCLPQSTLFNEQEVLQIKENIQNRIFQNDSIPTMYTSSKNNTNPFLQDMPVYNEVNDNISPGKFMQLWNENLKVQMEITITLNRLLNRIMKESEKNVKDDSLHIQDILNIIRDALLSVKQMPVFVDSTSVNIDNLYKSTVSSIANSGKNIATNNDFTNVEYPTEKITCTARNWQPLSTPFCDRNYNLNTCIASTQTNITPNAAKTSNLTNSSFLMPTNSDFVNVTQLQQFLTNHETTKQCVYPESEKCSNKLKLDSQNYFLNNTNIDLSKTTENTENNKIFLKETNPFRHNLAGKLHISDTNEDNCSHSTDALPPICKNDESVVEYDLINFDNNNPKTNCANRNILNDFTNVSLNHYERFMLDSSNKTSDGKKNSSLNCNWNVNNVANKVADVISDQSTQHSVHQNKTERQCFPILKTFTTDHDLSFIGEKNKQELIHDISNFSQFSRIQNNDFVPSEEISNYKTMNENLLLPSNHDMYNYKSTTLLPVNNLECSTSLNAENSNEECSTGLSTSRTLYSSSSIMEPSTNASHCQTSITNKFNESSGIFEEVQSKPLTNDNQSKSWSDIYYTLKSNEVVKIMNDNKNDTRDEQPNGVQNLTVEDLLNFQVNIDDTRTKNPYSKESELRSAEENLCIKKQHPLTTKIFFQVVELPKRMIHIFHYQDEGWLLVDEFVEVFTKFETTLHLLSMLCALNIRVRFEEIDRSKNSIEFIQTYVNHNTVLLKAAYDIINGATKLHLMQLKSAFQLLHKLEIISQEDILKYNKFMNNSIVHEIWLITSAYKQLKYLIKSEQ